MDLVTHYNRLLKASNDAFQQLVAAGAIPAHTQSHNYLADWQTMRELISDRPESVMLDYAITEYQYGLYALATGIYRHAFSSLRLFAELFLGSIQFSSQEIKFRRWQAAEGDIVWAAVVDEQDGVFSTNFVRAFFPELKENAKQYRAIIQTAYRQCSEYVHGNARTQNEDIADVGFKAEPFEAWHDLAASIHLAIVFAFCARFAQLGSREFRAKLQPIALDHLGHLPAIQSLYEDIK